MGRCDEDGHRGDTCIVVNGVGDGSVSVGTM